MVALFGHCSSPPQRRGFSANGKKGPASEEAGYSKSPLLHFMLKIGGPSFVGTSKMPALLGRIARNAACYGSIIGQFATIAQIPSPMRKHQIQFMLVLIAGFIAAGMNRENAIAQDRG